jgi:hypothetical protein
VRATVHAAWRAEARRRTGRRRLAIGAAAALLATVAVLAGRPRESAPVRPKAPVAAAAAASVVRWEGAVAGVQVDGTLGRRVLRPGDGLAVGAVIETPALGRLALALAGGASVRLDGGSRLTLAAPGILSLERGALYVDSGPDRRPGSGVEVRAAGGVARDVGTQFEVRVADGGLRVRVREGAVHLTAGGQAASAEAGEELRAAGGRLERSVIAPDDPAWRWTQAVAPPFRLEGATLAGFVAWSCRESGWRCRYAHPEDASAAAGVVLHGSVEGLTPEQAMAAVLPTAGFTRRGAGGELTIARAADGPR